MGVFLVFSPDLDHHLIDDRSVTTVMFLLRFGVGTSWLVTTQRISLSFRSLFFLFKARHLGKGGPTDLL